MRFDIAQVKAKNSILEVARELGLEVRGSQARCFRPERHKHNDRSPSLSFDVRRNTFKCFVCRDIGGSVIDLVMQVKGVPFREAAECLAERAGIKAEQQDDQKEDAQHALSAAADPVLFQRVSEVYEFLLESCGSLNREAVKYLHKRGISEDTARKQRLAYISDYGGMCRCLAKSFPQEILGWTGLFNASGRLRFYRHRLVFPFVMEGRVVYLQAKSLDGRTRPKEMNLNRPFPCPFNIDAVEQDGVRKVYLCEGVIDTLTLIERGLTAVGVPGINCFKKEWVRFFKGKEVLIVFDRDKPGEAATRYVQSLFVRADLESKTIVLPSGEDVNSYFGVLRQFEVK